ncbi:hypothetical protein B0T25DRAFT_523065 [Lasiosphaeria hispida]|uniref:Uncharacterized protein n=1 Tax=Lasiosphaeria hispida TaxID=260671 RepID=A0AAJ0H7K2_9PEZI|nr:hypothetical protein B0T25DRAFT_523065 [Lasiosphaeria hispida]
MERLSVQSGRPNRYGLPALILAPLVPTPSAITILVTVPVPPLFTVTTTVAAAIAIAAAVMTEAIIAVARGKALLAVAKKMGEEMGKEEQSADKLAAAIVANGQPNMADVTTALCQPGPLRHPVAHMGQQRDAVRGRAAAKESLLASPKKGLAKILANCSLAKSNGYIWIDTSSVRVSSAED